MIRMSIISLLAFMLSSISSIARTISTVRYSEPSKYYSIFSISPFERAVCCIKYYEGMHRKKDFPYVGYGHKLRPGEQYSSNMSHREADKLLRKDLSKLCDLFRCYGKDSMLLAALAYNVGPYRILGRKGKYAKSKLLRKIEAGIRDFIRIHDFPRGPLLLRDFDPRPKSFIPSGVQHKLEFADQLMSDFPDMRFILIGDDGQSDPSTYAKIAEKYPGRVAAIGIRRVSKKELAYFSFSRTFNSQNGKFFAGTDIPVFAGTDGKSLMDAMLPYLEKLTGSKAH